MSTYWLGIAASLGTAAFVLEMMRRGVLREKFAALWLAVSAFLVVIAVSPELLERTSSLLGFRVPSNFLFFLAIVFLLLVSVQLSYEVSKLESRTRRLAEDVALLAAEVRSPALPSPTPPPDRSTDG